MNSFPSVLWWEAVEALVKDVRFQVILLFLILAQWASRLPRPRKGAGDKCVLITGCDSAIGQALVERFDKMKMHVFAGFQEPKSTSALRLKDSCSKRLHIVPLDFLDENQLKEAAEFMNSCLLQTGKELYSLINICTQRSNFEVASFSLESYQDNIIPNLTGHMQILRNVLPILSKEGRVVTVTGHQKANPVSTHDATVHALEGFLQSLRSENTLRKILFASVEFDENFKPIRVKERIKNQIQFICMQREKKYQVPTAKENTFSSKASLAEQERNCKMLIENVEDAMLAEEPYSRYITAPIVDRIAMSLARQIQNIW